MKVYGAKSSIFHSTRGYCSALCRVCHGLVLATHWEPGEIADCPACDATGKDPIPWAELFRAARSWK